MIRKKIGYDLIDLSIMIAEECRKINTSSIKYQVQLSLFMLKTIIQTFLKEIKTRGTTNEKRRKGVDIFENR